MGRDEATERLRMMHGNLQGRPGHTQRAERRALAVAIEHLAADNNPRRWWRRFWKLSGGFA